MKPIQSRIQRYHHHMPLSILHQHPHVQRPFSPLSIRQSSIKRLAKHPQLHRHIDLFVKSLDISLCDRSCDLRIVIVRGDVDYEPRSAYIPHSCYLQSRDPVAKRQRLMTTRPVSFPSQFLDFMRRASSYVHSQSCARKWPRRLSISPATTITKAAFLLHRCASRNNTQ